MSQGVNRVALLGFLGADPELKHLEDGQPVLNFRMATSHSYLDRNKERQESTEWHSCSCWGARGEALAKILRKGAQVYVEGRLQTRKYEKQGVQCYSTSVIVTELVLTGARTASQTTTPGAARPNAAQDAPAKAQEDFDFTSDPGGDTEIPF